MDAENPAEPESGNPPRFIFDHPHHPLDGLPTAAADGAPRTVSGIRPTDKENN